MAASRENPTGDLINLLSDRLMQVVERAGDRLPEIGAQGRPASGDRSYLRTSSVHAGRGCRLKKMRDFRWAVSLIDPNGLTAWAGSVICHTCNTPRRSLDLMASERRHRWPVFRRGRNARM